MSKLISKAEFLMNRERAKQLYSVSQIQKSYKRFLKKKVEETKKAGNNREVHCTQGRETGRDPTKQTL